VGDVDKGRQSRVGERIFELLRFITIEGHGAPNGQPSHNEVVKTGTEVVDDDYDEKCFSRAAPTPQEHIESDEEVAENDVAEVTLDKDTRIVQALALARRHLLVRGKNCDCAKRANHDGNQVHWERELAKLRLDVV